MTGAARMPPGRGGGADGPGGGAGREVAAAALDPAVRDELLALLRGVARNALGELLAGVAALGARGEAAPAASAAPSGGGEAGASTDGDKGAAGEAGAPRDRRYPFAHGDVDLRTLPANVPSADERRPRRDGGRRRFYFLREEREEPGATGGGEAPRRPGRT